MTQEDVTARRYDMLRRQLLNDHGAAWPVRYVFGIDADKPTIDAEAPISPAAARNHTDGIPVADKPSAGTQRPDPLQDA